MPPISPIAPLFSPKFFSNSKQMPTKEWTEKFGEKSGAMGLIGGIRTPCCSGRFAQAYYC